MKEIICNGVKLFYKERGSGEPLLLLHGNGASHEEMSVIEEAFCISHRVISFDMRGHGQSEKGHDSYSIPLLANDILTACEQLGIRECKAVGFSDGGNVLLSMNKLRKDLIQKSVLLSPNYKVSGMRLHWVIGLELLYFSLSIKHLFVKEFGGLHSKTRLMLRDYKMTNSDLENIQSKTLILEAEKDMIRHKHLLKLDKMIQKSRHEIIKDTTHFTIVNSLDTIKSIKRFFLD